MIKIWDKHPGRNWRSPWYHGKIPNIDPFRNSKSICSEVDPVNIKTKMNELLTYYINYINELGWFLHCHRFCTNSFQAQFDLCFSSLGFGFLKIKETGIRLFKNICEAFENSIFFISKSSNIIPANTKPNIFRLENRTGYPFRTVYKLFSFFRSISCN